MPNEFGFKRKLYFLASVRLAAIPLYLLAKRHFDVWTEDEETERWLENCLLSNFHDQDDADESLSHIMSPWWFRAAQQSDLGILLEVRNEMSAFERPGDEITEFLIYATVSKFFDSASYLPSPPASSSPLRINGNDESSHAALTQKVRFRAVPLASTAHQGACVNGPCISPATLQRYDDNDDDDDDEAYFLPTIPNTTSAAHDSPHKRQRLLHLFEDATYQRKQLRRRGGESISKAMAGLDSPSLHLENQRGLKLEESNPLNTQKIKREKMLSRSSSTPSSTEIHSSWLNSKALKVGNDIQGALSGGEGVDSWEQTPTLPTKTNSFEDQNKSVLTRIIMAGMRIYGLQQRRKPIKLQADSELGADSTITDKSLTRGDDEYKTVYHQTLKVATFTFRNQINKEVINQATMGDVVDQLLALFCTDPLAVQDTRETYTSSFGKS